MNGQFKAMKVGDKDCVVQQLAQRFKDDAEIRLALIANGADPAHRNGGAKPSETKWVTEAQWDARKARHARREDPKTKLARIANGTHPKYKDGKRFRYSMEKEGRQA